MFEKNIHKKKHFLFQFHDTLFKLNFFLLRLWNKIKAMHNQNKYIQNVKEEIDQKFLNDCDPHLFDEIYDDDEERLNAQLDCEEYFLQNMKE